MSKKVVSIYRGEYRYSKNVYIDLCGLVRPTPMSMPKDGIWYFDGQIFYQPSTTNIQPTPTKQEEKE